MAPIQRRGFLATAILGLIAAVCQAAPGGAAAGRVPQPLRIPGGIFRDYHSLDLMQRDRLSREEVARRLERARPVLHAPHPGHVEGPVWHHRYGVLFCGDGIQRVVPGDPGARAVPFLNVGASGILRRRDGHYICTDNRGHRILDLAPDGSVRVLADSWNGQPLRLTNDLTMDERGVIYWTDPANCDNGEPNGWIMRLTPDGKVERIATGLYYPNGIEVDPENEWLYVVQSTRHNVLRYRLPRPDRALEEPQEFLFLENRGVGDGLTVDMMGNLYIANFSGRRIEVFTPKGRRLGAVETPGYGPTNVTFGRRNTNDLYITADGLEGTPSGVLFAELDVPGFAGFKGKELRPLLTLDLRQPAP